MEQRFRIEKSQLANHYIVEDMENHIFCLFEKGRFNQTQTFSKISADLSALQIAKILRELGDWLVENHRDLV